LSAQDIARRVTERVAAPLAAMSEGVTPAQDSLG